MKEAIAKQPLIFVKKINICSKNNVDNVPIYPIKSYDCDIIIVVHLSYKNNIDRNGLENSRIIEIYPSIPLEIINGIGTINIKKDTIEHNIKLGYRDAMVIIAPMIIEILKGRSIEALVEKNDENNKKLKIQILIFLKDISFT